MPKLCPVSPQSEPGPSWLRSGLGKVPGAHPRVNVASKGRGGLWKGTSQGQGCSPAVCCRRQGMGWGGFAGLRDQEFSPGWILDTPENPTLDVASHLVASNRLSWRKEGALCCHTG